jgi:MoaA/NifB/PqqE/SkfB family radical SAM enzyme
MSNHLLLPPRQATIKVNRGCNSLCAYCYAWKDKSSRKEVPLDGYLKVIDQLAEIGVQNISFTGGEPLLRSDLEQMAVEAQMFGIYSGIITNGLLLTPERYHTLYSAGVRYFNISLDSLDPVIYKDLRGVPLQRVLEHILAVSDEIQNNDGYITLICVVNRLNLPTLPELACFAYSHRMRLMLQPVQSVTSHPEDKTDQHLLPWQFRLDDFLWVSDVIDRLIKNECYNTIGNPQEYLRQIPGYLCRKADAQDGGCAVGYTDVIIDDNLSLRPCWRLPGVANLEDIDLRDAWTSSAFMTARSNMKKGVCPSCWLLYKGRM